MSLLIAWCSVLVAVALGVVLGVVSGYFGRRTDAVIMRLTDSFLAVPTFFVLLLALALFGPSMSTIIVVIGATSWMPIARIVRSEVLKVKEIPFVEAARALGATNVRIVTRHVQPQTIPSTIVAATVGIANSTLIESSLSYLGLGVQPPLPALGNMLRNAQDYLWNAPALAAYPGLVIVAVVLGYNWVGDGLRDAFDPHRGR